MNHRTPDRRSALIFGGLLAVTLSLAACEEHEPADGRWSSPGVVESANSAREPVARGRSRLIIAWRALGDANALESVLLRDDGEGYRVVGTRPGATLLVDGRLWLIRREPVVQREVDCTCAPMAGFGEVVAPQCIVPHEQERVLLVQSGGERQQLMPSTRRDEALIGSRAATFELRASVGGLILGDHCVHTMPCGAAHGAHACRAIVWDVAAGGAVELLSPVEQANVQKTLRPAATRRFSRRDPPVEEDEEPIALARVDISLSADGGLDAFAVFTGPTSYADSSEWAAYKAIEAVSMPTLPDRLRNHTALPSAVRGVWNRRPQRFGWSVAELTATQADGVARRFSAMRGR